MAVICNNDFSKFILLKEYRPALKKIHYTLPGGGINKLETPQQCIKREVLEEISIKCKKYKFLGQIINNGSYHFGEDCVFLATVDFDNIKIYPNKEEYILGYEIFEWKKFMEKEYRKIKISGVLSALMLAYIYLKKNELV